MEPAASFSLSEQGADDVAVHVGQAVVSPLKAESQFGVIKAQQVHNGRLEVVNVDGVFGDGESEFVGFAVLETAFDAAASEPDRIAVWIMIAA